LVFTPGVSLRTFAVPILDDAVFEGDETVLLSLSNPVGAELGTSSAELTIVDDESSPVVSFEHAGYAVDEDVAEGSAAITVTLTGASAITATVDYEASDGTAGPDDYTAVSGTLVFTPGVSLRTFAIPIIDDELDEFDESVLLTLSEPVGAELGISGAVLTIVDDEGEPTLSIADASAGEGDGTMVFDVTLSHTSTLGVSVEWTTSDGPAGPGGALSGSDYTGGSGTLEVPPNSTGGQISIPILPDDWYEGNEIFTVQLSSPLNASVSDDLGQGTIVDDEDSPMISFDRADYTVDEDVAEGSAAITVTLTGATAITATVDYEAGDRSAGPDDYTAVSGTLVFTPGVSLRTFAVPILDDVVFEGDEMVLLSLSNPVSADLGTSSAELTIVDDESSPVVSFEQASYTVDEDVAEGSAPITVTLTGATAMTATVDYEASDGSAGPDDYTAVSGTLIFTPGVSTQAFAVPVTDDELDESDETVLLFLDSATNADFGLRSATLTILDDDLPPEISIGDVSMMEAGGTMLFPVSLSLPSELEIQVSYATSSGTDPSSASPGTDYDSVNGNLNIPTNTSTVFVSVPVYSDSLYELNETFTVTLSSPGNATLSDYEATGTILNDDEPPQIEFETGLHAVGEEATTVILTVTLSGPTELAATVDYTTADGPLLEGAKAGEDYVPSSDTLTFLPGEDLHTILISLLDDEEPEVTESFDVVLSGLTNSTLGSNDFVTVWIIDDDAYRIYLPLTLRDSVAERSLPVSPVEYLRGAGFLAFEQHLMIR
jgi:hypothetical protein